MSDERELLLFWGTSRPLYWGVERSTGEGHCERERQAIVLEFVRCLSLGRAAEVHVNDSGTSFYVRPSPYLLPTPGTVIFRFLSREGKHLFL